MQIPVTVVIISVVCFLVTSYCLVWIWCRNRRYDYLVDLLWSENRDLIHHLGVMLGLHDLLKSHDSQCQQSHQYDCLTDGKVMAARDVYFRSIESRQWTKLDRGHLTNHVK